MSTINASSKAGTAPLESDRAALLEAPPAAPWRRAMARAVDAATVFFVLWMLAVLQLLRFVGGLADRFSPEPWGPALVPTLVFCVAWGVYEAVFLRYNDGQTPAKDLFNVRVVRRAGGSDPTLIQAALRWLLPGAASAISWPILDWPVIPAAVVAAIGVTALFGAQRRAIHDHLTGTIVVHYRHRSDGNTDDTDASEDVGTDGDVGGGHDFDDLSANSSTVVAEMLFGRVRRRSARSRRQRPRRVDRPAS